VRFELPLERQGFPLQCALIGRRSIKRKLRTKYFEHLKDAVVLCHEVL
jgi:hypothetical protein